MTRFEKILVTGADGFIGSHLCEYLVQAGYSVRAMVFYNSFNSWGWLEESPKDIRKSLEVIAVDIRDSHHVRAAVKGCDGVLHLAALISIPFSYYSPEAYIDTNIKGTLNVLQACRDLGIKKIVHTSTSEVYGTAKFVPITEDHPLSAQSPYASTKIGADQLALSFYSSFQTPVTVLRPFNTYGPRQSARAVIPTIITQIASGRNFIRLGSIYPTRDFVFVEDTVKAFEHALKEKEAIGQVIHVGTGHEFSIGDTAKKIAKIMDRQIVIKQDKERIRPKKSEIERLVADPGKARRTLKWSASYAGAQGFEKGLRKTIDWFTKPANLRRYKANLCNI